MNPFTGSQQSAVIIITIYTIHTITTHVCCLLPLLKTSSTKLCSLNLLSNRKSYSQFICKFKKLNKNPPGISLLSVIRRIRSSQSEGGESLSSRFLSSEVLLHAVMGCHSEQCCVCPLGTLHHGKVRTELRLYRAGHRVKIFFFCPAASSEMSQPSSKSICRALGLVSTPQ